MKSYKKILAISLIVLSTSISAADKTTLLNTSYDIARELFAQYNPIFIKHWKEKTGKDVEIKQSHAGPSKQARAILQGLRLIS